MPDAPVPQRLFLDAGVLIQAFVAEWGAPKALLVLATVRGSFTIVLAHQIEREVRRAFARRVAIAQPGERRTRCGTWHRAIKSPWRAAIAQPGERRTVEQRLVASLEGWLARVALERLAAPAPEAVYGQLEVILPALRHTNDLEAVVSAMQARPDWVISTNTDHWGPALAARTGMRIGTPIAFLEDVARTYAGRATN